MKIKNVAIAVFCFVIFLIIDIPYSQRASIQIDTILQKNTAISNCDCEQIANYGSATPTGYELIARGYIQTGPATFRCGKEMMTEKAMQRACEIGADAVRFYEVKDGNMINTCFLGKILFLKKKE